MRYEAVFTPTVEDLLTGYRMHNRQRDDAWKLYLAAGVGVFCVFGIAALVLDFPYIAVVGVLAGGLGFSGPILAELSFRRLAKKFKPEEVRLCFSDEGVEFASRMVQGKHAWDLVTKATLDERGIILYTGPLNYSFVPARAFVSGYFPREELKALLLEKLKKP